MHSSMFLFALLCSGARGMGSPHPPLCRAAPSRHFERMGLALQRKVSRRGWCPVCKHNTQPQVEFPGSPEALLLCGRVPPVGAGAPCTLTPPFLPEPCLYPERKPQTHACIGALFEVCPLFRALTPVLQPTGWVHFRKRKTKLHQWQLVREEGAPYSPLQLGRVPFRSPTYLTQPYLPEPCLYPELTLSLSHPHSLTDTSACTVRVPWAKESGASKRTSQQ